ncbi:hypothetical protein ASE98_05525 [Pseudomonas sp. Leaf48]|nr:hypothetical protein ASE98_05525 [Pseudomonas sp. Leaf48]
MLVAGSSVIKCFAKLRGFVQLIKSVMLLVSASAMTPVRTKHNIMIADSSRKCPVLMGRNVISKPIPQNIRKQMYERATILDNSPSSKAPKGSFVVR